MSQNFENSFEEYQVPPEHARSAGFVSNIEQKRLGRATVAIAGAGGDGFDLAMTIAMMSNPAEMRIADPEVFELENSNRVAWADRTAIGRMKVDVLKEKIADIRPDTKVVAYHEGVTPDNVADFVDGADLVVDESELNYPAVGISIAQAARRQGIPNLFVMNIGFGAVATSFHPESEHTFEKMMGFPTGIPIDEIDAHKADLTKCLPCLPRYGHIDTLKAVVEDDAKLPSLAPGVKAAVAIGSTEAFLHLTAREFNHRPDPVWNKKWIHYDPMERRGRRIIKHPRFNYHKDLSIVALRSYFGINPRTGYSG